MKSTVFLLMACVGFIVIWTILLLKYKQRDCVKPIEEYLVEINDPNWITNYGVDLESRLVYNVAMLNKVVNSQGIALRQLLEREPNK